MLKEKGELRGKRDGRSRPVRLLPNGITKDQSSQWKRVADLPKRDFESVLKESEPTTAADPF